MPTSLGDCVLNALDEKCGAVISDRHVLYFLVEPGAADGWAFPEEAGVRVLGEGSAVVVPPVGCPDDECVCWVRPVRNGRVLTGSRWLHAAMQAVIAGAVAK